MGRWFKHLGTTSGAMLLKPLRDEWSFWRNWLSENYPDVFQTANSKTSPTQGLLSASYRFLDIPTEDYTHSHRRGVFIYPFYTNYREFLTDQINEDELDEIEGDLQIGRTDNRQGIPDWFRWWYRKSKDRVEKLKEEGRVADDPLFHDYIDINDLELWLSARGAG